MIAITQAIIQFHHSRIMTMSTEKTTDINRLSLIMQFLNVVTARLTRLSLLGDSRLIHFRVYARQCSLGQMAQRMKREGDIM